MWTGGQTPTNVQHELQFIRRDQPTKGRSQAVCSRRWKENIRYENPRFTRSGNTQCLPLPKRSVRPRCTCDGHIARVFADLDVDATMETMVAEPYVYCVPVMTGGGGQGVR